MSQNLLQEKGTVWVIVGNYADDPHPKVLGVYDNDDAARRHQRDLKDTVSGPIAWGMHEVEVRSKKEDLEESP